LHCPDNALVVVAQQAPKLSDTLDDGIIADDHVRPNRRQQFILGDEATRIGCEITQEVECLGPQSDFFVASNKPASLKFENVSIEPQPPWRWRRC
jgi:hypothetical protein